MTAIPIVCANCGAKYRLPETFKADSAKCKACGAVIDVRGQMSAGPAAAKPARTAHATSGRKPAKAGAAAGEGARGASARGRRGRAAAAGEEPKARASARGRGRGRGRDEAEADGDHGHGHHRRTPQKSNPVVLYGSLVGLVAVIAVVLVFVLRDSDEPAKNDATAKAGAPENPADDKGSGAAAQPELDPKAAAIVDALGKLASELPAAEKTKLEQLVGSMNSAEDFGTAFGNAVQAMQEFEPASMLKVIQTMGKASGAPEAQLAVLEKLGPENADAIKQGLAAMEGLFKGGAPGVAGALGALGGEPDTAKKPAAKTPAKKGGKIESRDQVYIAKDSLPLLELPAGTSDADKQEILQLGDDAKWGDASSQRALMKLEKKGHAAIPALINVLRDLDYFSGQDTMTAFAIHKTLAAMFEGLNVKFEPVIDVGAEVSLDIAHTNGRSVWGWHRYWEKYKDPDTFAEEMKERRKKASK